MFFERRFYLFSIEAVLKVWLVRVKLIMQFSKEHGKMLVVSIDDPTLSLAIDFEVYLFEGLSKCRCTSLR